MAAPCPLLGDGITDDTLLHIARFLLTATDLLRLGLTCPRFATIVEEAARLWVVGCSEQERGWVPQRWRRSQLGRMHEVEVLRLPLAFDWTHADITLSENGAVATRTEGAGYRSAASKAVMGWGRHFAQFTVLNGCIMMFGVTRSGWNMEGGVEAVHGDGNCFYGTVSGICQPGYRGNSHWEGMQSASEQGDRIGMLLDRDQGSMTVWKNDAKLGVMKTEGLNSPCCWAVSLFHNGSARVESAPPPASPTEEELDAAKAWQRRSRLGLAPTATDAESDSAEAAHAAAQAAAQAAARAASGAGVAGVDAATRARLAEKYG